MRQYQQLQYVALEKQTLSIHDDLHATLLNYQVNDRQLAGDLQQLPISTRYRVVRFLHAVDQARNSGALDSSKQTLKVMVAPEFFFRDNATLDSYQDVTVVTQIYALLLRALSTPLYQDWLFIPGSVFWHSVVEGVPQYFNTTLIINGGGNEVPQGQGRTAQGVRVVGKGLTTQKALMSPIDYAVGIDKTGQDGALNDLFSPIIGDLDWRRDHVFTPYGKLDAQGSPLLVGVETCLEHVRSTHAVNPPIGLIKDVDRELQLLGQTLPPLHLQVVTSCGMRLQHQSLHTRQLNGYALLCDGNGSAPGATGCTTQLGMGQQPSHTSVALPPLAVQNLLAPGVVPPYARPAYNTELKIYQPVPL